MVAILNGIIFEQVYGDNSGGSEFDTDGDGTATQEDEFVAFQNTTGAPVDISGWQVWSDMSGDGAPDGPQDGLYHTFADGTILGAGKSLYIVNEISGTPDFNMQEASEGGTESGAGGINTNFITEGDSGFPESLALVNPDTGDYIIFNMSATDASGVPGLPGFPGTTLVGESNAATDSGEEDQNAGSSYQYNAGTDSYDYGAVFVACFAKGTLIAGPTGERPIQDLRSGDLVQTLDHGLQPLRLILTRHLDFDAGDPPCHKPIAFQPGTLGPGSPDRTLIVSPQHRMLIHRPAHGDVLTPAKGLTEHTGVRLMKGRRQITYYHLVFSRHQIVRAQGCWSESFYPGATAMSGAPPHTKSTLIKLYPELAQGRTVKAARQIMGVTTTRMLLSPLSQARPRPLIRTQRGS